MWKSDEKQLYVLYLWITMMRSHDDEYDDDYNEDYIICENNSQINFYFNILELLADLFLCVFNFWVFCFV